MPFNGAGQYTPPPAAPYPAVGGTTILASQFNNVINDIATALSNCITRDGQSPATANIPLGGFKLTGVGAPGANNDALTFGQAGTMTTLTATTSVVTPLVRSTAATLDFGSAAATWAVLDSGGALRPATDNTQQLGLTGNRISAVFTPIIDSGTTGSLSLRTNNGTTQFAVIHIANAINLVQVQGAVAGAGPTLFATGGSTNIPFNYTTQGTGAHNFITNISFTQVQILHTASANRALTLTGANSGNPTIGTTGGNVAISTNLAIGTTPATTGTIQLPSGFTLQARNAANSANLLCLYLSSINGVNDITFINGGDGNSNGVIFKARTKAGAPTASDLNVGDCMVWRDTSGATTKLYYNNAGSLQSVALA
jgi:hypothetical protein